MKRSEVLMVVNRYVGVERGYLADFTCPSFEEFFVEFCNLDIDPYSFDGPTTRYRFISILEQSAPAVASKILKGILEKYPVKSSPLRTKASHAKVLDIITRLDRLPTVASPATTVDSEAVRLAIADADRMVEAGSPTSAVDRMHTAPHGYLRSCAAAADVAVDSDASITKLYKELRKQHPALTALGPHSEDVDRVLRSFASAIDSLNTLRNQASVAHPNASLLPKEEEVLYINAVRTLMAYLEAKLSKDGDG